MTRDEIGADAFMDEDQKILNRLRHKKKKPGMNMLNDPNLSERDMDEIFLEV
jgi:hypothetical protein